MAYTTFVHSEMMTAHQTVAQKAIRWAGRSALPMGHPTEQSWAGQRAPRMAHQTGQQTVAQKAKR